MNFDDPLRSKKLTPQLAAVLLERLDQQEAAKPRKDRRSDGRISFRRTDVPVLIIQPGGGASEVKVATRDLNETGISFLHAGYLHRDTECRLTLKRRNGDEQTVVGTVAWCRLVSAPHHLVGMRFRSRIVPKLFVEAKDQSATINKPVDVASLTGRVLHVDDQELDRKLFAHHLRGSKVEVISADDPAAGIVHITRGAIDVVVCDILRGGARRGESAIELFRKTGYDGPIIILTAETNAARLSRAQAAGASLVINKPYERQLLLRTLSTWLSSGDGADTSQIVSEMASDAQMLPLIENFVSQCSRSLQQLHQMIKLNDIAGVRSICHHFKANGSGLGFPQVSAAATEAAKVLDARNSISNASAELKHLESICRRLTVAHAA